MAIWGWCGCIDAVLEVAGVRPKKNPLYRLFATIHYPFHEKDEHVVASPSMKVLDFNTSWGRLCLVERDLLSAFIPLKSLQAEQILGKKTVLISILSLHKHISEKKNQWIPWRTRPMSPTSLRFLLTKDLLRGVSAAAALSGWCKHWSPKTKAHLKLGEFGGHRWS